MENNQKVFVLLNGKAPQKLPDLSSYALICTTDGGYNKLLEFSVMPDLVVGDFDSSKNHKANEVIHTPDQEYTDFEKLLQLLYERGNTNLDVFGASGDEQDHFLGNLHVAVVWKDKLDITFFDDHGTYFLATQQTTLKNVFNKTISLLPLPLVTGIFTRGLLYPLNNEFLEFGKRVGTRNKAIADTVEITYKKGNLVIFVNN